MATTARTPATRSAPTRAASAADHETTAAGIAARPSPAIGVTAGWGPGVGRSSRLADRVRRARYASGSSWTRCHQTTSAITEKIGHEMEDEGAGRQPPAAKGGAARACDGPSTHSLGVCERRLEAPGHLPFRDEPTERHRAGEEHEDH